MAHVSISYRFRHCVFVLLAELSVHVSLIPQSHGQVTEFADSPDFVITNFAPSAPSICALRPLHASRPPRSRRQSARDLPMRAEVKKIMNMFKIGHAGRALVALFRAVCACRSRCTRAGNHALRAVFNTLRVGKSRISATPIGRAVRAKLRPPAGNLRRLRYPRKIYLMFYRSCAGGRVTGPLQAMSYWYLLYHSATQGMLPEVWSCNFQTLYNNNFEHSDPRGGALFHNICIL